MGVFFDVLFVQLIQNHFVMDVLPPLSEHITGLHDFRQTDIARDYHIRGKHGIFIFAMDNAYKLFSPEENPPTEDGIGSG